MSAKLNALVLLSIAALIGGCGGGGSDGDAPAATDSAVQSASPAPASGKDPIEQRTN
ncbi:hypothetical protein [Variovorax sp. N23]|uniref:hypothetical protein n=1 Tax=Variovorax sp. N23 TaxID=2980555 RepID=UPI0021C8A7A3|nr:hypothetical protein [Variovorax sp. N23]MCU4120230.1 hypothetical protein [Variovorax sp. N23]